MWRAAGNLADLPPWLDRFGIRSGAQLARDLRDMASHAGEPGRVAIDLGSAGLLRPRLSLPAYAGLAREDRVAPIFNLFDRVAGGRAYRHVATRSRMRDYRGGRLSYDEHDGTDFVCPPGTAVVAAAPGVLVAVRDTWLRGGLTACVDHGHGVVTQYTHVARVVAKPGDTLARGALVGHSGHGGIDMTLFFPWVPPHLHFSVWVDGVPIDPYVAAGEARGPGTWLADDGPVASGPREDDPPPPDAAALAVLAPALDALDAHLRDARTRAELAAANGDAARAAIAEDSLHHHRDAWSVAPGAIALRPPPDAAARARIRLTLPLDARSYDRAAPADTWWTRPPA